MKTGVFVIRVHPAGGGVRLELSGELDQGVIPTLEQTYRSVSAGQETAPLVIDVTRLEFCDLSGQRELFRLHGAGATIVGAPPCLQRLFALTGHQQALPAGTGDPWPQASFARERRERSAIVAST